MAQLDPNQYKAVWKHKTPLNSNYLNILFEGQEPGLVSLPTITPDTSSVTVGPFSAFVQPVDDSGNYLPNEIMKVVVTQDTVVTVVRDTNGTAKTRGIGLKVIKTETETRILIDAVDAADCATYKGIFIASVLYPYNTSDCWATVNGADYSDILLTKLGYDPSFWVSPVSPRRNVGYDASVNNLISLWEIRYHNDNMKSSQTPQSLDGTKGAVPFINIGGNMICIFRIKDNNFNLYNAHSTTTNSIIIMLTSTWDRDYGSYMSLTSTEVLSKASQFVGSLGIENLIPMAVIPSNNTSTHIANTYVDEIRAAKLLTNLNIEVTLNELRIQ